MGSKFGRKSYQIAIAKDGHLRTQKLLETSSTEALSLISGNQRANVEGRYSKKMSYTPGK